MIRGLLLATAFIGLASAANAQDAAKGETVFKQCLACHAVGPDAKNKVGPQLNGIVGRKWGAIDGFAYSSDIKDGGAAGKVWDKDTLNTYLENPKSLAPKGKMAYAGLKNPEQRADLIAYLGQFDEKGAKK